MEAASDRSLTHGQSRYEVESELARGGMGVVYRVRDRTTGLALALKRSLALDGRSAEQARSMLQREYQTLITLRHPHIIRVYDFGVDDGGSYYTMELLEGADLRAKCPLPWRDVCLYLRDVASSLALLHSRRLLHCDVSVANIWLTKENRAKLLDFGALASFGRNATLAGAPPTTAPEVLAGDELDQRVDLYALGASAYYALTGRHAYPATLLALLPAMWARGRPAPPSSHVPDIPAELDELVLSLLEHDRLLRPSSAADVIDRLEAIAGLAPDRDPRVLRSYLQSTVVIGRDATRRQLADKLKQALSGRTTFVLLEGTSGLGKSFLVEDLEQQARVGGARVVKVHSRAHGGTLGVWNGLLREIQASGAESNDQTSLVARAEQLLFEAATVSPLMVAIEDLQEADTDSLAALLALAKSARRGPVLIVMTLDPSHVQAARPALHLLRSRSTPITLTPFDEKTTQAFVVGLFGPVPAASRLGSFLYEHAAGNPQAYRAVIDHFIDQEFIRYVDGLWVLPNDLPVAGPNGLDLSALVNAAFESRVGHWNAPLRGLARCLSPTRSRFDLALCEVLAAGEPVLEGRSLSMLLSELVREGLLTEERGSYAFARQAEQDYFYSKLSEAERQQRHLRLGQYLAKHAGGDGKRTFEIGFHFLLAGQLKKARDHLNRNVETALRDPDMLIQSVPDLRALLKHQRAAGASDEEVQFIEGMLVLAGYYVDPTVYDAFSKRVACIMHRTMGFALASRLAPWLGQHLALAVGMLVASLRGLFRTSPYLLNGGSFAASVLTFIGVCVSMNAGACARLDRPVFTLLFELLAVTSRLGRFNALRYLYDQFKMGEDYVYGRANRWRAGVFDQLERLPRLPLLAGESEHQLRAGLLFSMGLNSLLRLGGEVPEVADRIDALGGKHDRLRAQLLRQQYHLYRGDLSAAKREEERFDEVSAQFGSRWVSDGHVACMIEPYHLTADVLGLKRSLHRIELLLPVAPHLGVFYEVARAMYEGHRGRPDLALAKYNERSEFLAPFSSPVWALAVGHKAECLNALGRHAEALAVCEEARGHLTSDDRQFVFSYQQLERESALALAGLGRFTEAVELSDKLLTECASGENPLIRGLLHFDRARIARAAGDSAAFDEHALAAKADLTSTRNPSAIARINRLLDTVRRSTSGTSLVDDRAVALKQLIDPTRRDKAARLLEQIATAADVRSAHLYLMIYGKAILCAQYGDEEPDASLESDLGKLATTLEGEVSAPTISRVLSQVSSDSGRLGRLVPIVAAEPGQRGQLVALVVLGQRINLEALAHLDFGVIASELSEAEEATETVYSEDAG